MIMKIHPIKFRKMKMGNNNYRKIKEIKKVNKWSNTFLVINNKKWLNKKAVQQSRVKEWK